MCAARLTVNGPKALRGHRDSNRSARKLPALSATGSRVSFNGGRYDELDYTVSGIYRGGDFHRGSLSTSVGAGTEWHLLDGH